MHMVAAIGLAVKVPWLGLGGPIPALAAWTGLENVTLTLCRGFISGQSLTTESAEYCMLVNELRSRVCLLRLEVDLGSVLESDLGQKWRYSALKACMG